MPGDRHLLILISFPGDTWIIVRKEREKGLIQAFVKCCRGLSVRLLNPIIQGVRSSTLFRCSCSFYRLLQRCKRGGCPAGLISSVCQPYPMRLGSHHAFSIRRNKEWTARLGWSCFWRARCTLASSYRTSATSVKQLQKQRLRTIWFVRGGQKTLAARGYSRKRRRTSSRRFFRPAAFLWAGKRTCVHCQFCELWFWP